MFPSYITLRIIPKVVIYPEISLILDDRRNFTLLLKMCSITGPSKKKKKEKSIQNSVSIDEFQWSSINRNHCCYIIQLLWYFFSCRSGVLRDITYGWSVNALLRKITHLLKMKIHLKRRGSPLLLNFYKCSLWKVL